jgi:PTH2 family peptidyl-tRNA hydrolase
MKQVIVVRTDLEMSAGKLVAQACHASVAAALCAPVDILELWNLGGQKKIALQARSLSELVELKQKCEALALVHALVSDAGRTELTPGTATALAIEPADEKLIDKLTGAIPLL